MFPSQGSNTYYNPMAERNAQTQNALSANAAAAQNYNANNPIMGGLNNIPVGGTPSPFQPPQNTPTYYQVKGDDADLAGVATQMNVPLGQLTSLNNTKTLPPKGSYLQLTPTQLVNQGVPASVANQVGARPKPANFYSGDEVSLQANALSLVQNQLKNGSLPSNISISMLPYLRDANGQPTTLQDWLAEGYVVKNGMLLAPGAPGNTTSGGGGGGGGGDIDPRNYIVTWNKNAKNKKSRFKTNLKWMQNAWRRKAGKGKNKPGAPRVQAPINTTAEGPQTILDIHLGSG